MDEETKFYSNKLAQGTNLSHAHNVTKSGQSYNFVFKNSVSATTMEMKGKC